VTLPYTLTIYSILGEAVSWVVQGVPTAGSWPGAYGPGKTYGLFLGISSLLLSFYFFPL
jgi:hypothetical protein